MTRIVIAVALLALSSAALAADVDSREMREIQARYGECVVKKYPADARGFVLDPNLDEKEYRRRSAKLIDGECLNRAATTVGGVQMRFPLDTMRYTLADALVRREFGGGHVALIKHAARLMQPTFNAAAYEPKPGKTLNKAELDELTQNRDRRLALVFLSEFGECVVRANAEGSHTLLTSETGSAAEAAAFTALSPNFGNCIPAGPDVKMDKSTLRGTIAMNYYRLAHAPRVAATAEATK